MAIMLKLRSQSLGQRLMATIGILSVVVIGNACSGSSGNQETDSSATSTAANVLSEASPVPSPAANLDYSRFNHDSFSHTRLPCLVCHVRGDNNAAKISFPGQNGHVPCASCHVQQFADPNNAMCTICHTESATGALKAS